MRETDTDQTTEEQFAEMTSLRFVAQRGVLAQQGIDHARASRGELLARKRRGITRFQITESIHAAIAPAARKKLGPELVWVPFTQLETITLSGPHRRWVTEILAARNK